MFNEFEGAHSFRCIHATHHLAVAQPPSDSEDFEPSPMSSHDASDVGSVVEYDSDVVECDNAELDDRDPGDVTPSKQPSPLPRAGTPPPPGPRWRLRGVCSRDENP